MAYIDQTRHIICRRMETIKETDNITKNIVREVVRECKSKGKYLDENYVIYFVKLLLLEPKWGIAPECQLNREKVSFFVKFCVTELIREECPCLSTLMAQHVFMSTAYSQTEMIMKCRSEVYHKLAPLREEIFDYEIEEKFKQQESRIYKKIVIYIVVLSGLGNPKDNAVLKEATFALQSVFDEKDVVRFTKLSRQDKESQIIYLSNIVAGIRLFNMKNGKATAGVSDLSKAIKSALETTRKEIQEDLVRIMEKVNILTQTIEKFFVLEKNPLTGYKLVKSATELNVNTYVRRLIGFRQLELYLRRILLETELIAYHTQKLYDERMKLALAKLNKIVKFKVAILINQVFPLFHEIADCGKLIQDQAILLAKYNTVFMKLHKFSKKIEFDKDVLVNSIGSEKILTDAMRLEKTMGLKIKQAGNKCKILNVDSVDLKKESLEYLGFCPWSIVETNGGLIPGNPNMGICEWKKKLYVFSCLEAAETFGNDPDRYIMSILEVARSKIELIHFLQIFSKLMELRDIPVLHQHPTQKSITNDVSMQTELHPIPSYIDVNYKWNVWDLYREAIHWANISECKTHSTQTYKSHWRAPAKVQTFEYRDKQLQTKIDNYTNVPTLSNFIFGLRGRTDDIQHVIELTRPVKE